MLDPAILKSPAGTVILDILQKHDVCYEIQSQALPGIISFWREVTEVIEKEPLRVSNHYCKLPFLIKIDMFMQCSYNLKAGLGFSPAESYFSPVMGRKGEKYLSAVVFTVMGRNSPTLS